MTRDDAIRLLTNMKGYTHITLYEWLDVEKEAIDMAIEALQNLSKPNNGLQGSDLISRQDAIKAVFNTSIPFSATGRTARQMKGLKRDAVGMIKSLPSAEVVHKPDYSYEAGMVRRLKEALSAEAVEVVRCKDCKHYKKINPKAKSGICYTDIIASAWNDDGFCSRSERKGGDDE